MKIYAVTRVSHDYCHDTVIKRYGKNEAYFTTREKAEAYVEEHADRRKRQYLYRDTGNGFERTGRYYGMEEKSIKLADNEVLKVEEVIIRHHEIFEIEVL